MPAYRFYALSDGGEGAILRMFFNDQVAVGWAFRSTDACGVEIWHGSRFVARLHAGVVLCPTADVSADSEGEHV